jgi:citrate synthase
MSGGLEGVIAAETVLSHTDANAGRIWVRGHELPVLVAEYGFEGTVALLWDGFAGEGLTRSGLQATFGAARVSAFSVLRGGRDQAPERSRDQAESQSLFEAVRRGLAALPDSATPAEIVGAMTMIVATLKTVVTAKTVASADLVAPDPELSTAADLLRMWHGAPASAEAVAALDTYFTVMLESGLSASSFTARIVASTRASLAAAVVAAWCAFTGPLHGGAPGPTLDMLDAAAAAPDLDAWIETRLRSGERVMGFGHRVFHGNDPRARAMREALSRMGPMGGRLAFAAKVEARVDAVMGRLKPGRRLPPNVEIMAALLLDAVGFPPEAFTPIFAVSRIAGWIAHALEQGKTGRMIRPTSRYVGPVD